MNGKCTLCNVNIRAHEKDGKFYIKCPKCNLSTDLKHTLQKAKEAWDKNELAFHRY